MSEFRYYLYRLVGWLLLWACVPRSVGFPNRLGILAAVFFLVFTYEGERFGYIFGFGEKEKRVSGKSGAL